MSAPSNGPVLPGGRFGFAYPYFSDEGSGVSTAEGFISFFAGAKHNPDWFDYRAARGQDIRALNPRGMYFKHVNLRILDSRHRGRTGRSLDGLPDHDWIHANHPEWIVRDREGKTVPLYLPEEQILDFGNDAYLDWVVNTWMPQQLFDNVDKNAAVIYLQHDNGNFRGQDIKCAPNDKVCERYTTDAGVQGAWLNMLKRVRQAFPKVRIIISTGPNTYTDPDYQMEIFKKILSAADGYYGENLTDRHVYWKNASPGEKRVALETTIRLAAWLSENDKIFMPIEGQYDGIPLSQDDTDYAFAFFNLLRTSSEKQFFSKLTIGANGNWVPDEYPEMFLPLGAPIEEAKQIRVNMYRRNYELAVAYVNLSDAPVTINLPGSPLKNSRGATVSKITLKSFGGITLYKSPCSPPVPL